MTKACNSKKLVLKQKYTGHTNMFLRGETNNCSARVHIRRARYIRTAGTGALCSLVLLTLLMALPISHRDDHAEAVYVPSTTAISIVSSKDTASVNITPTSGTGSFATSAAADQAEFTVTTDNLTGYSLNILGGDTSGQLVNAVTGDTLDTIAADTTENDFRTGSAATYVNKWGYRLNVNGASTTNFMAAPTTATAKTIYTTSAPNTTPDDYTLGLGTRVDYTKPAGTYSNTFVVTALSNPVLYELNYLDTTSDSSVANLPAAEGNTTEGIVGLNLSTDVPTRDGYTFLSWCDGTVTHTAGSDSTCSGVTYDGGDPYNLNSPSATVSSVINMYAMWTPASYSITLDGNGASGTYTSSTTATFGSTSLGTIATPPAKDSTSDSRTVSGFTAGVGGDSAVISSTATLTSTSTTTYTLDGWYKEAAATNKIASGDATPILESNTDYTDASGHWNAPAGQTLYAGYTATTGAYSTVELPTITKEGYTCGWGTISSSPSYEYQSGETITPSANLVLYGICNINTYSLTINFAAPGERTRSTPPSGVESVQIRTEPGTGGTLVDTISVSGDTVTDLPYDSTYYLYPTFEDGYKLDNWAKTSGKGILSDAYEDNPDFTVKDGDAELTITGRDSAIYIQDVTIEQCIMLGSEGDFNVVDRRDGISYTARLINGNCWMTSNLRFEGTQLSPDTSDVLTDVTITKSDNTEGYGDLASGNNYTEPRMKTGTDINGNPTAWYNYAAASAKRVAVASSAAAQYEANMSICPKGWRLPTYKEGSDIMANATYRTEFNPVFSGRYGNGSLANPTIYAFYWTSSAYDNDGRYTFYQNNTTYSSGNNSRYYGNSVRCVLDKTMQSVDNEYADSVANGSTVVLRDARDNNTYKITKIGTTLWMNQNLRVDPTTTTMDSTNTNLPDTYTPESPLSMTWQNLSTGSSTTVAKYNDSGNTAKGIWYNYLGTTAGEINGSATTSATQDICPKGWRLPNRWEASEAVRYNSSFDKQTGGEWTTISGSWGLKTTGTGHWWTSTTSSTSTYRLIYESSSLSVSTNTRYDGRYVRCVYDNQDVTIMQEVTPSMEHGMADGDIAKMVDIRDNNFYSVAKINGHLWMTQNLRLSDSAGDSLNSSTSNVASEYTPESPLNITWGSSKSSSDNHKPSRAATADNVYMDRGNWYNYRGATANTITSQSQVGTARYDICPKGWKLPSKEEFESIFSYTSQFKPTVGGAWWVQSSKWDNYSKSYGYYFTTSKVSSTSTNIYMVSYNGSSMAASSSNDIGDAYYARCIYGDYTEPTYMQDVTSEMAAGINEGESVNLVDKRDNNPYTVAKINGQLWMTQNLAFGASTLDSTTSNIASEYTPESPLTINWGDVGSDSNHNKPSKRNTGNANKGYWYNYSGATAGTITSLYQADPIYDICPKGWRLPTRDEYSGIVNYKTQFKPTTGGGWWRNSHENGWYNYSTGTGWFFSSTMLRDEGRISMLKYNGSTLSVNDSDNNAVYDGYFVRCVYGGGE